MSRFSPGDIVFSFEGKIALRQYLVTDVMSPSRIQVLPYSEEGLIVHRPQILDGRTLDGLFVDVVATRLLSKLTAQARLRRATEQASRHLNAQQGIAATH